MEATWFRYTPTMTVCGPCPSGGGGQLAAEAEREVRKSSTAPRSGTTRSHAVLLIGPRYPLYVPTVVRPQDDGRRRPDLRGWAPVDDLAGLRHGGLRSLGGDAVRLRARLP